MCRKTEQNKWNIVGYFTFPSLTFNEWITLGKNKSTAVTLHRIWCNTVQNWQDKSRKADSWHLQLREKRDATMQTWHLRWIFFSLFPSSQWNTHYSMVNTGCSVQSAPPPVFPRLESSCGRKNSFHRPEFKVSQHRSGKWNVTASVCVWWLPLPQKSKQFVKQAFFLKFIAKKK